MGCAGTAIKGSSVMRVQDLGQLDGPVLLFGGPYSNLPATRALIAKARALGIGADHMICTGDLVAYCASPKETVAEIRALGCAVVAGNCEKQLAANALHCGCGFEEGSACDLLSAGWYAHANARIGAADRQWMAALPDILCFHHQGRRCAVIHGGVRDISRFLWPVSPEAAFQEELDHVRAVIGPVDMVIAGHCGIAFQRDIGAIQWLNAGVIGMPPNNGRPKAQYAVLRGGTAEILELSFDHASAARQMAEHGLTQGYDRALLSGYWPSEDVLPPSLRRSALASG